MRAKKLKYDHYGLAMYETEDGEFAVGTDAQADKAARDAAYDSLWAFRASYIVGYLPIDGRAATAAEKAITKVQEDLCEDAGPIIELLLGDKLESFLQQAVNDDGRGHFLAGYDFEEVDSDSIKGLPKGKVAFRTN
jgi:hypothetical protein